jgi:hypothetical protein
MHPLISRSLNPRPLRGIHGGAPTYFRASCLRAAGGGKDGYDLPGWHLANAIGHGGEVPYDVDLDEWEEEVQALTELPANRENDAVLEWFTKHYPNCMVLVPTRRRDRFISGVRRAYEEERVDDGPPRLSRPRALRVLSGNLGWRFLRTAQLIYRLNDLHRLSRGLRTRLLTGQT